MRSLAAVTLCGCWLLGMPHRAVADDASKHAKLVELMKLEGLDEVLERQRGACRKQAQEVGPQMLDQMMKGLSLSRDDPHVQRTNAAYLRFLEASEPSWTADEAVDLYAKLYGAHVTEGDVDELLQFFKAPLGQKAIAASRAAIPEWTETLQKKNQEVLLKNIRAYSEELNAILRDVEKGSSERSEHAEDPPL